MLTKSHKMLFKSSEIMHGVKILASNVASMSHMLPIGLRSMDNTCYQTVSGVQDRIQTKF